MWDYKRKTCHIIWGYECKTYLSLEKIWMGQMGRLEEKIAAVLLYWLHSFPLACLIFFLIHRTQGIGKNDSNPKVATFFMLKKTLHSIVFWSKNNKLRAKQEANIIINLNILESQRTGGGGFSLWGSEKVILSSFIPNIWRGYVGLHHQTIK